eukprot:TRINITY_DN10588_c0_g1_i1.p1 TRINITY_DN10588_c0_g1~~TRINITY_DN10588_c0_g1_i1.p1  ORF type:complete len:1135 (-),score=198.24 TRINITY_DN10588_c0_g1_i1:2299-5703(-)
MESRVSSVVTSRLAPNVRTANILREIAAAQHERLSLHQQYLSLAQRIDDLESSMTDIPSTSDQVLPSEAVAMVTAYLASREARRPQRESEYSGNHSRNVSVDSLSSSGLPTTPAYVRRPRTGTQDSFASFHSFYSQSLTEDPARNASAGISVRATAHSSRSTTPEQVSKSEIQTGYQFPAVIEHDVSVRQSSPRSLAVAAPQTPVVLSRIDDSVQLYSFMEGDSRADVFTNQTVDSPAVSPEPTTVTGAQRLPRPIGSRSLSPISAGSGQHSLDLSPRSLGVLVPQTPLMSARVPSPFSHKSSVSNVSEPPAFETASAISAGAASDGQEPTLHIAALDGSEAASPRSLDVIVPSTPISALRMPIMEDSMPPLANIVLGRVALSSRPQSPDSLHVVLSSSRPDSRASGRIAAAVNASPQSPIGVPAVTPFTCEPLSPHSSAAPSPPILSITAPGSPNTGKEFAIEKMYQAEQPAPDSPRSARITAPISTVTSNAASPSSTFVFAPLSPASTAQRPEEHAPQRVTVSLSLATTLSVPPLPHSTLNSDVSPIARSDSKSPPAQHLSQSRSSSRRSSVVSLLSQSRHTSPRRTEGRLSVGFGSSASRGLDNKEDKQHNQKPEPADSRKSSTPTPASKAIFASTPHSVMDGRMHSDARYESGSPARTDWAFDINGRTYLRNARMSTYKFGNSLYTESRSSKTPTRGRSSSTTRSRPTTASLPPKPRISSKVAYLDLVQQRMTLADSTDVRFGASQLDVHYADAMHAMATDKQHFSEYVQSARQRAKETPVRTSAAGSTPVASARATATPVKQHATSLSALELGVAPPLYERPTTYLGQLQHTRMLQSLLQTPTAPVQQHSVVLSSPSDTNEQPSEIEQIVAKYYDRSFLSASRDDMRPPSVEKSLDEGDTELSSDVSRATSMSPSNTADLVVALPPSATNKLFTEQAAKLVAAASSAPEQERDWILRKTLKDLRTEVPKAVAQDDAASANPVMHRLSLLLGQVVTDSVPEKKIAHLEAVSSLLVDEETVQTFIETDGVGLLCEMLLDDKLPRQVADSVSAVLTTATSFKPNVTQLIDAHTQAAFSSPASMRRPKFSLRFARYADEHRRPYTDDLLSTRPLEAQLAHVTLEQLANSSDYD